MKKIEAYVRVNMAEHVMRALAVEGSHEEEGKTTMIVAIGPAWRERSP